MIKNCLTCNKEFDVWLSHANRRKNCSWSCRNKYKKGKISHLNFYNTATVEQKWNRLILLFNNHVIKTKDGCWSWKGTLNRRGYGKLKWNNKDLTAHRASWMIHYGPIPDGMFVCHHCDTPICTRPTCLFLGTAQDNVNDMIKKGRQSITSYLNIKGRIPHNRTITEEQAIEIKKRLKKNETTDQISKELFIGKQIIYNIKYGKSWRHIIID